MALLFLWEVDHAVSYPSQAVEQVGRLCTFTTALRTAVAADPELSVWLSSRNVHMRLTPGLPISMHRCWSVRMAPEVGEPFLSRWKAHLADLIRRTSAVLAAGSSGRPPRAKRQVQSRPPKRPREDAPAPPSNSREERVKRLRAAQAVPAVTVAGRRYSPPHSPPSMASGSSVPPTARRTLSAHLPSSFSLFLGETGAGACLPRSAAPVSSPPAPGLGVRPAPSAPT